MTEADESLVSMERAAGRLVERILADEGEESDDPSSSGQQASHEADPPVRKKVPGKARAIPEVLPPRRAPRINYKNGYKTKCEAARRQLEIMLRVLSIEQLKDMLIAGIGYVQWPLPGKEDLIKSILAHAFEDERHDPSAR